MKTPPKKFSLCNLNLPGFVAVILFVALLIPSMIAGYILIDRAKGAQAKEQERFSTRMSSLLASSLSTPLWELRKESAMDAIKPILQDERVISITVTDALSGETFLELHPHKHTAGNLHTITKEITNNDSVIGTLKLKFTDAQMKQHLQKQRLILIATFALQLLAGIVILVLFLYKKVIAPVNTLVLQAKQISNNDLDTPFVWHRTDEIGKLGKSFEYARTSLRQTLHKIQKQTTRLENIIEGTNVGTWEWNVQTGKTVFNDKWAQMIGYELSQLQPTTIETWIELAHPDDVMESERRLKEHFEGQTDYYEFEGRMRHRDGHYIWVLDRGKVTKWDKDGKPVLMFGTHQDITRQKTQEFALKKLNNQLNDEVASQVEKMMQKDKMLQEQAKLAAMGEMIGAIAHQWRQPLNALFINIENLEDDYEEGLIDEAFLQRFIQKQTDTIQFMSKTIEDFRNFFKTDKSEQHFSLLEVFTTVRQLLGAQLKNHNITLAYEGEDFTIKGYKSEVQQVMLNVITNSQDAITEQKLQEGKVTVILDKEHRSIYICDNAGGVAEDELERIFEPYFTSKQASGGTGIGLHMSRVIISDHMSGRMYAYNGEEGLCVVIEFAKEN